MTDFIGVTGLAALAFGTAIRYGYDVACILVGAILLSLAIVGAMRK